MTAERAAAALAATLAPAGPVDLILGGDGGAPRQRRLVALVAGALGILLAGHASGVTARVTDAEACVRLTSATTLSPRERPLPAAVLIEAGTTLRPFPVAGYLHGWHRDLDIISL